MCYAGTIIDVLLPGNPRVFWGYITPENVVKTVDSYITNNKIVKQNLLGSLGEKSIKGVSKFTDLPGVKYQSRIALKNSGNIAFNDIYQYIANDGFSGLNKALNSMSSGDVINEVKNSGLRGRGGAAFPTGVKWSFMANSNGKKYILCNCEEGDPGAFNDKGILESDPFTLIEGMIIAGYATNSTNGYVFIRHGHEGPMNEASKMDPFKKRVYDEFEANCQHVLGVSGDRVREVLLERGHDIFEEFEAAYEFAGAAFMRQSMSWRLCALEQVYHETKIGRELTDDEQLERFTNWDVGLNAETLDAYYYTCMTQQDAEKQKNEAGYK